MESLGSPIPNHEIPSPPYASSPNLQCAIVLQSVDTGYAKGISLSSLALPPAFGKLHVICCCHSVVNVQLFDTPWTTVHQASLSFTISQSLLKLMSIKSMMPSNHLILCCLLLLLPSIFPSIRVFSNKLALRIKWPKYWSFNFSISPSNEYSGLTSFRIYWFDVLAVQGTFKSPLQHYSSKVSILWHSAFFSCNCPKCYKDTMCLREMS